MTSVVPHYRHTFKEYLLIEKTSEVKHEYLNGEIYVMAGASAAHGRVTARLIAQLVASISGRPCDVYPSDFAIRVRATGLATYPDVAIVCDPAEFDPESPIHCTNPVALFEVLSPSTEAYDRGEKREHYQQIDSLREYVIVAQDRPYAEKWARNASGEWRHEVVGADGKIRLESVNGEVVLADLYRRSASDAS